MSELDDFTKAYIEAALWSSTAYGSPEEQEKGESFDASFQDCGYDELAPEALNAIVADCAKFQAENGELFNSEDARIPCSGEVSNEISAGHDFWLTRNRHGAGFWDGDWEEPAATALTDAAHAYGEVNLYLGDDGLIYL